VAWGIVFLFWTVAAGLGLFGRLTNKRLGRFAVGFFLLGFAAISADYAIGVFQTDPTARFHNDGYHRRAWFGELVALVYSTFGPSTTAFLLAVVSVFFACLAVLTFWLSRKA